MPASLGNVHEYTVSELAGAVKKSIENEFGFIRVRGEVGKVSRAASGHMYLDLKDERAVLSSVIWKGNAARLRVAPEQGMEVVATGRMTTFPGQSRYQLVIDNIEPAGVGALMALFEQRKQKLAAEGLFAQERKRALPYIPEVVGVVTSPSGAVIRDILHRLRERFPRRVIVWPTVVQGRGAEEKIAAAITGFNALPSGGDIPRPDVLIVARGGGSLEDLWCFNEEVVARAAAASDIPLISAVGHETDTTLIDYVADRRAPTPTAAAEIAVPVRADLRADVLSKTQRMMRGLSRAAESRRAVLIAAARGLGRPEDVTGPWAQRLDRSGERLPDRMRTRLAEAHAKYLAVSGRFRPGVISAGLAERAARFVTLSEKLDLAVRRSIADRALQVASRRPALAGLVRTAADLRRETDRLARRLSSAAPRIFTAARQRLDSAAGLLASLSYENVLSRGFALVRRSGGGELVTSAREGAPGDPIILRFSDGERDARLEGAGGNKARGKRAVRKAERQTSLFD